MRRLEFAMAFAAVVALLGMSSVVWAESIGENESNAYVRNNQEERN